MKSAGSRAEAMSKHLLACGFHGFQQKVKPFARYLPKFRNLYAKPESELNWKIIGPSGVRALPLAAGINVGGHYKWHFGPSGVRALPLAAGINVGGHYF